MTSARTKLTLALGFAAGYVLGTKAGRQRYQQITDLAQRFAGDPRVRDAVDTVKAEAASVAVSAKHVVEDKMHKRSSNGQVDPYPVGPVVTVP